MTRAALYLPVVLAAALAGALLFGGCGSKKSNTIRIGEFGSLTGDTATFGISTKNGIDLAVDEINKVGGVLGKKLEVFVEDDRGQGPEAATAVTRLINQYGVCAVLGEVASTRSLAAAPICQRDRIPMISPASTNASVTQQGDYIFRICFIDPFQGTVMAKFAHDTLKARKVALFFDKTQDYSTGLKDAFRSKFQELGGTITKETSYSSGDFDFKAQLTDIASTKPDAVFIPGYYTQVGQIARQAREVGLSVPLMGGDGWDSPELTKIGGKALENTYYSNHYSFEDKNPRIQEFVSKYKARFKETPDAMAALGYDAAHILADALKRAGSTSAQALRDAIAKTAGFGGVTGNISLDANRNAVKPAVVLQVKNGKVHFMQTVQP